MDSIKVKNFCSSKETIKKMKRQATKWEKIFFKTTKDLYPEYISLLQLNSKKTNNPIKDGQKICTL